MSVDSTSGGARNETLRAGAGRAAIELPAELFPKEGFCGVHDMLHVRALLVESRIRIALVSIELTSLPEEQVAALQEIVGGAAGLPPENVWICATHTFSAPHILPKRLWKTTAEQEQNHLLSQAVKAAALRAASQAVSGMEDARLGCGRGFCDVNVNRDVLTADGWWLGCNETGPSDKSVTVIRLETLSGNPIALLFCYGVQPSVNDVPATSGGGRLVSADMAGAASRFIEQEYDDTVTALFCLGAAGDQAPALKGARFQYVGKDGSIRVKEIDERGFVVAELLGARLGAEVLRISERIRCQALLGSVVMEKGMVRCPGQEAPRDTHSIRPTKQYAFVPAEPRDVPVGIVTLGEIALIGLQPELCCQTAASIKGQSPFSETLLLTMVNGGAKYMADTSAYDRITYEAMNSPFARGCAELLCEKVVGLLHTMKK